MSEFDEEGTDSCESHRHVEAPFPMADAASWRVAVELVRRHPGELWIIRTYPDDHWDCLSVRRLADPLSSPSIAFDRSHSGHIKTGWLGDPSAEPNSRTWFCWGDALTVDDPRDWLRELERDTGLSVPTVGLPASTPSSLVLRWIATFLSLQLGSRERWSAWNDWRTVDYGMPAKDFDVIPDAATWLEQQPDKSAAAFVWFVGTTHTGTRIPLLSLSVEGHLWQAGKDPILLPSVYASLATSSLSALVAETGGGFQP